jgi:hypothetical protein
MPPEAGLKQRGLAMARASWRMFCMDQARVGSLRSQDGCQRESAERRPVNRPRPEGIVQHLLTHLPVAHRPQAAQFGE